MAIVAAAAAANINLRQVDDDRVGVSFDETSTAKVVDAVLHAFGIEPFEVDGVPWISFAIHPVQRQALPEVLCRAPLLGQRLITSSSGHQQLRYVIRTEARIGETRFSMDLSLTDRDQMGFRLLIGREAMRRRLLIDPTRSFQLSER